MWWQFSDVRFIRLKMLGLSFSSAGPTVPAGNRRTRVARALRALIPVLLMLWLAPQLPAQTQPETQAESDSESQIDAALADSQPIKPVPIFSAGLAYNTFFEGGTPNVHPLLSPVVLIPRPGLGFLASRPRIPLRLPRRQAGFMPG